MFNHLRTLLLNESGLDGLPEGVFAEEHVPPEYRPLVDSSPLRKVRAAFFGTQADRSTKNYRLRQLMPLLHTRELEPYVLALDPRVTYWPPRDETTYSSEFSVRVTQNRSANSVAEIDNAFDLLTVWFAIPGAVAGTEPTQNVGYVPATLYAGPAPEMEGQDITYRRWFVINNNGTIEVYRRVPEYDVTPFSSTVCVFTGNLSQTIELPGVPLGFRVHQESLDAAWTISTALRPSLRLDDLLPTLQATIDGGTQATLFGSAQQEPYKTFSNLWRRGGFMPLCVGGLLLAFGYRLHEQWLRGQA